MITSCAPMPFIRSNIPSPCSAGNLFGTTRSSQPGVFGALPFWRDDRISGGVIDSRPWQNGHCSRPIVVVRSRRKSLGRFWRSVEMITQRPVTGSRRSSGIESVLNDLHDRIARVEMDRHDVEAARAVGYAGAHHVLACEIDDSSAFEPGDRFGRRAERVALASLHFDEHQRPAVTGDDVNFATARAVAPRNNCVPAALQLAAREIFSVFSENLPSA